MPLFDEIIVSTARLNRIKSMDAVSACTSHGQHADAAV